MSHNHISQGKHKKSARRNLDEVKTFLARIDSHLAEVAEKSVPSGGSGGGGTASPPPMSLTPTKKRKSSDVGSNDTPKKKKASKDDSVSRSNESLTIPQREQRALEQLGNYLEECGGKLCPGGMAKIMYVTIQQCILYLISPIYRCICRSISL